MHLEPTVQYTCSAPGLRVGNVATAIFCSSTHIWESTKVSQNKHLGTKVSQNKHLYVEPATWEKTGHLPPRHGHMRITATDPTLNRQLEEQGNCKISEQHWKTPGLRENSIETSKISAYNSITCQIKSF